MKFWAVFSSISALTGLASAADAPINNNNIAADLVVPNRYIVKYKDNASASSRKTHEATITLQSKKAHKKGVIAPLNVPGLQGYVADLDPADLKLITSSGLVEYVERDTIVNATDLTPSPPLSRRALINQRNAPWNLAHISHKSRSGSSEYVYDSTAGIGTRVYIIGTGVLITHDEFQGRASHGANFVTGSSPTDEFGHGTCVAAIVGGKTYGVAKRTTLISVKVLDKNGSGTTAGIIQAINWSVAEAVARGVARKSVLALTVGGAYSAALNQAVLAATNAGVTVVVGAGSSDSDAKDFSPMSAQTALTVAAIDGIDRRTANSNWGLTVDLFAPGISILTAYIGSNSATRYMTGTAMAAPHVAGLAAYFIAKENLNGHPAVYNRIISASITGRVSDPRGSNNRVAYNGSGL
ncbi:peptidase S8/S53 domain-containing protein [Apiosordaria backusii]|uniref:Peptidase S8/S53 domain-containing protein n=1 Tax=Apiosordaria backusii TaxID=314023 RepID=A0AA40BMA8_9PEZI|nr:peptidase S8/S53 domain-containing protein [Apiosordaria backusii]